MRSSASQLVRPPSTSCATSWMAGKYSISHYSLLCRRAAMAMRTSFPRSPSTWQWSPSSVMRPSRGCHSLAASVRPRIRSSESMVAFHRLVQLRGQHPGTARVGHPVALSTEAQDPRRAQGTSRAAPDPGVLRASSSPGAAGLPAPGGHRADGKRRSVVVRFRAQRKPCHKFGSLPADLTSSCRPNFTVGGRDNIRHSAELAPGYGFIGGEMIHLMNQWRGI
jgi:hypothetical protein